MAILDKIQSLLIDIESTSEEKCKKDKIITLVDYVAKLNEDIKNTCSYLKNPYLNENKLIHLLLEIQIQTRLMQIGDTKSFHEIAVYLFNIRMLIDNVVNQPRPPLYRVIFNQ
ncbi:hypothetical protein FGS56_10545 [Salmonella enterica]|nr:hypothetical protein [Salmonella enterica]EKS3673365.1 hypothetical protein [Salmonella enterica]ELW6563131.1 hypothetical protein [Salmonella enterica]ELZ1404166.1 hypothetical protein [Salmonella enterica]